ncbi:hypothetical protein AXG93_3228s1070 [Marchantia polymorpha subsp. ruderalis]|uniref:Uncharacterized protein n=1 Tax=Marchantia polymorpha subsp. ruderalis TaxID=1480154 RepID=A0A176WH74_MARPO|nr:hypothetical protein AXG93_3228s1070 [Marchantia polymorpha subsp. ruderalis]
MLIWNPLHTENEEWTNNVSALAPPRHGQRSHVILVGSILELSAASKSGLPNPKCRLAATKGTCRRTQAVCAIPTGNGNHLTNTNTNTNAVKASQTTARLFRRSYCSGNHGAALPRGRTPPRPPPPYPLRSYLGHGPRAGPVWSHPVSGRFVYIRKRDTGRRRALLYRPRPLLRRERGAARSRSRAGSALTSVGSATLAPD